MKTKYIVEIAKSFADEGKHAIHASESLRSVKGTCIIEWVNTFDNIDDAIELAASLKNDKRAIMVMVAEWVGGQNLETGNIAVRHCASGAKIKSIPFFVERKCTQSMYSTGSGNYTEVQFGEWLNIVSDIHDYDIGGGNWLSYTPTEI